MYGSLLQVLEQSIENVGSLDRKAITANIKSKTFKTIVGDMDLRNQQMTRAWTVGQWQNGFFQAVGGQGFTTYKPVNLKTNW
jgi:branched-chain amino acid transport system substrate-binding protein